MSILGAAILGSVCYEGLVQLTEWKERHDYWGEARDYCDQVKKPLLRVGMRRGPLEPPNGDVTIDIDDRVMGIPGGVLGDERRMPFSDKQFGVCFNEHTLEHLGEVDDVKMAIRECVRVADYAVLLCPSPYSLYASLFCPTHRLRLWFSGNEILVVPNEFRTGFGVDSLPETMGWRGISGIDQAMVLKDVLPVIGTRWIRSGD